jgi:hypothetical protein
MGPLLLLSLLLASSGQSDSTREKQTCFEGVFTYLQHGVFRSVDGKFYELRTEDKDKEAQEIFGKEMREADKSRRLCLVMRFRGDFSGARNFVGREIVNVRQIDHIKNTECEELGLGISGAQVSRD